MSKNEEKEQIIAQLKLRILELERDLENVIHQCQVIAAAKIKPVTEAKWICRNQPGLNNRN